jgi:very-short-patch-repair endonuclease
MDKFTCKECNREFDSYKGLQNHNSRTHKISGAQTYVNIHYNGEWPICKCGCNEKLNYFSTFGFGEYIQGHAARVNGGFYSEKGAKKSGETRKTRFGSGELSQWNKGKVYEGEELEKIRITAADPKRRAKISKALKGKPKSEEHKKILLETLARNRKEILKGNPSKLEYTFASILESLNVEFTHQYHVDGFEYDFYVPSINTLIEIDGDYWHANPIKYTEDTLNNTQKKNLGLDKLKNQLAESKGYKLIRFWENDIVNNRLACIEQLIGVLK